MNGLTVACTGRVGSEPERKYTPTGKALLNFSVCVDQSYTADEQRAAPEPIWLRCTVWAELAEQLGESLKKGTALYIEGRLTHGKWTSRDGEPRCGLSVSAWKVEVHGAIGRAAPKRQPATTPVHPAPREYEGLFD